MTREYSRRHVLAGLGTVGVGLGASIALFTGRSRAYTSYTMVSADVGNQGTSGSQSQSDQHGLRELYRTAADVFPDLRVALNRISDRYLFPARAGSVSRLLRQVSDAFDG